MVADPNEEIGERGEDQMVVEALPRTAFVVIEPKVVLSAEEVLLDVPTTAAEAQTQGLGGPTMQVHDKTMIRLRVSGWPVDQQPGFLQLTVGVTQSVRQPDALPRQARATGRAIGRFPRGIDPVGGSDLACQFPQGLGRWRAWCLKTRTEA